MNFSIKKISSEDEKGGRKSWLSRAKRELSEQMNRRSLFDRSERFIATSGISEDGVVDFLLNNH